MWGSRRKDLENGRLTEGAEMPASARLMRALTRRYSQRADLVLEPNMQPLWHAGRELIGGRVSLPDR